MTETTTPEPEWLTSLRCEMAASLGDAMKSWASLDRREDIAYRATVLAASYLRPLHAELGIVRDEYEGTETRRAELEADVRALGGDPDRMVDPRDHEAAVRAMREAMQPDQSGPHIIARIAVDRARDVAEEHMLRMAQASLGAGPEVREVPAGEAREGDTVTIVGEIRNLRLPGRMIVAYGSGSSIDLPIDGDGWTVSRPVSPLPDQPGAVIRCHIAGLDGIRVAELETGSGGWITTGIDDMYPDTAIELIDVLWPAGAGVGEGRKR